MYKFLTILFCFIYCLTTQSQTSLEGYSDYRDMTNAYLIRLSSTKVSIKDIEGTPFLNEDFKFGYIIDTKFNNKAKTYLRYDVYNDIFEIQLEPNSKSLKKLKRTPRYEYIIDNERFVLIQSSEAINDEHYISGNGFVVELTSPKKDAVLYKRYYKDVDPGVKAKTSYQKDIPPRIESGIRYIIKFGNTYVRAEDHKRKILDAFPDHQKEIKKYIKDKEFKFRGDDKEVQNQMIQVVRYYNSL